MIEQLDDQKDWRSLYSSFVEIIDTHVSVANEYLHHGYVFINVVQASSWTQNKENDEWAMRVGYVCLLGRPSDVPQWRPHTQRRRDVR